METVTEPQAPATPAAPTKTAVTRVYRVDIETKVSPLEGELAKSYLVRARTSAEAENYGLNKFLNSTSKTATADDVAILVAQGIKIEDAGGRG